MTIRHIVHVVVLLALTSCAPDLTFRIEGPATNEQRTALIEGIVRANTLPTDAKHKLRYSAKGDYRVSFPSTIPVADGPDADSEPDLMGGRECTRTGKDCPVAPSIRVLNEYTGERLLHVMLHELFHTLHMKHTTTPGAVMTPGSPATQPTAADVAECKRVGACPRSGTPLE